MLAGVDDFLEAAVEWQLVLVEKLANAVEFVAVEIDDLCIGAQRLDFTADIDAAAGHILAKTFPGVAEDDDAATVHHVAGHEICIAPAKQGALLHHLAGTRTDIALDDDVGAANSDGRDGTGVAIDDNGALIHVVADAPADVAVDGEIRTIREPGAEVTGGTVDADIDRVDEANANMVAGIGVEDFDVFTVFTRTTNPFVRFGNRDFS